ncbi:MAG: T9SS type A sorting domain-containing protein [Lentimicrobium sp.]|nr:T9SS type A sorting domain-containing protein [Lentimicrobium sp.]MEA5111978.1 T9SS type A sorting domain-containing protein [Lentimicrobium sp.]
MKRCLLLPMLFALAFSFNAAAQTYYPLPEENAYWTVLEFDYNTWQYNDVIFTVMGDSVINNLNYKVVYRLDDYPTIYDTISTLHCFMRQSVEEKKIWFIRNYLGETQEKLGYDLSAAVGDTVSLPAFQFSVFDDSLFYLAFIDSIDMSFIGELNEYRKFYVFFSLKYGSSMSLEFIEGIKDYRSTFPNLDILSGFDPFHQSETVCVQVNGSFWFGYEPYNENCGFLAVGLDNSELNMLEVFPNPVSNILTVRLPEGFKYAELLTIYNTLGEVIMQKDIGSAGNSFAIDVSTLNQGLYFLNINSHSSNISVKLIIKH